MSRTLTISLFIAVSLIIILLIGRITHLFSFHIVKDYSLLPSIGKGSIVVSSNLKKYTPGDIIYCSAPDSSKKEESVFRRIAGLEGDTIEINNGYLLRNRLMVDNLACVMFNYYVKAEYVKDGKDSKHFKKLKQAPWIKGDSVILPLSYKEFKYLSKYFVLRLIDGGMLHNLQIFGSTNENHWNTENFGPVVVPKGQCFVLADNRDNYTDSRFFGFIAIENIKETLIW